MFIRSLSYTKRWSQLDAHQTEKLGKCYKMLPSFYIKNGDVSFSLAYSLSCIRSLLLAREQIEKPIGFLLLQMFERFCEAPLFTCSFRHGMVSTNTKHLLQLCLVQSVFQTLLKRLYLVLQVCVDSYTVVESKFLMSG